MPARPTNFYRTLQVDPAAEDIVIRAAYRALMKQYHPDRGGDAAYAQQLNAAYATLADPVARQAYDRLVFLRRSASERRPRTQRPAFGPRSLMAELGEEVFRRFLPDFPEGLARVWDFTGVLRGAPRHRLWIKRVPRGDASDARAFAAAVEAARLSRPLWGWGSDLFVAVLPAATTDFRWLLRGPTGPVPRLSWAVTIYDLAHAEVQGVGRCAELPAFRPFVIAVEAGRTSASASARPNT
jgi:hypothetical protein